MKLRVASFKLLVLGLVFCCFVGGCAALPAQPSVEAQQAQAKALVDSLTQARETVASLQSSVAAVKATAAAATQPIVVAPATATQPAVVIPTVQDKQLTDAVATIQKTSDRVDANLQKANDVVAALTNVATNYQKALADAKDQQAARDAQLAAVIAAINTAPKVIHDVAPNTPADNYAGMAQAIALAVVALISMRNSHSATMTAITTPGTTVAPGQVDPLAPPAPQSVAVPRAAGTVQSGA